MLGAIAALLVGSLVRAQDGASPGVEEQFDAAQLRFDEAQKLLQERPSEGERVATAFRQAADRFRALHEEQGVVSAWLFTNAGNAYQLAGDPGEAALFYARALLLDPDDERALSGLRALRATLPWRRPAAVAEDLVSRLFFWHGGLAFGTRRALFLAVWPLAFVLLFLSGVRRSRARWLPWAAGVLLLAGASLLGSLTVSIASDDGTRAGVVLVTVQGRTGDGPSYGPSHSAPLPPGSEVRILEERPGSPAWLHVELPDRSRAWIPADVVGRVVPR